MKAVRYFCTFLLFLLCHNGFTAEGIAAKKTISFQEFTKLLSHTLSKGELTKLFGKPSEVVDFKKLPGSKETGESWNYDRFIFFFDEGSTTTDSWKWEVTTGQPEQNLRTAMSRFGSASWDPETDKWINPHSFPYECYFKDKKLGISIEYSLARKEVFSISHWDPSRKLTSADKNEKRPVFCIGNSCSPAYSAEEFFKDIPVSKYCELPK